MRLWVELPRGGPSSPVPNPPLPSYPEGCLAFHRSSTKSCGSMILCSIGWPSDPWKDSVTTLLPQHRPRSGDVCADRDPVVVVTKSCPTLCDPVDCQARLSMGLSRQEYWRGLPFPSPGDLPRPGIKPAIGRQVLYHWATRKAQQGSHWCETDVWYSWCTTG